MMSIREQQVIVDDMLDILERNGAMRQGGLRVPLNSGQAEESIEKTVDDLLDLFKESGQFLTAILKLPPGPQMAILECVNEIGQYGFSDRRLKIRLRNTSESPVKIGAGVRHYRVRGSNGQPIDLQRGERLHRYIKPGETIELPAKQAAGVLARYCKEAFPPTDQSRWPHDRDVIREVGYSYREQGSAEIIEAPIKATRGKK